MTDNTSHVVIPQDLLLTYDSSERLRVILSGSQFPCWWVQHRSYLTDLGSGSTLAFCRFKEKIDYGVLCHYYLKRGLHCLMVSASAEWGLTSFAEIVCAKHILSHRIDSVETTSTCCTCITHLFKWRQAGFRRSLNSKSRHMSAPVHLYQLPLVMCAYPVVHDLCGHRENVGGITYGFPSEKT